MTGESGHTFEQTFTEPGVRKYARVPHEMMGMKGAAVVGGGGSGESGGFDLVDTLTLGGGLGLVGALFATFALGSRETVRGRDAE